MKRKIFSLLIALCIVLTFVVATSAEESTKYNVTVNVEGGVVADTGSTTQNITVNEGSTLSNALSGLTLTSNGAKSDADPVSTDYYPANARDIATGNQNTFIIDTSGNLWACGYNDNGQLGDQNNTSGYNTSYPSDAGSLIKVNVVDNGAKVKLKAVAAGESHTLLLDESGNVWTCGNAESGRIGRNASSSTTSKYYSFEKIALTENDGAVTIADIAAGYDFSLLLDSNGHVWACGENGAGQLGLGNSSNQSTFTRVTVKDSDNNEITFKAMSAGYKHSILLDKNNNVWVAGEGDNGRLGTGSTSDVNTFTKLTITENNGQNTNTPVEFAAVSAGIDHSLLIDSNGSVWACGNNSKGQLGLGNTSDQSTFTKIDTQGVKFTQVVAGYNCSLLLDSTGGVWTCGQDNGGNLGGNAGGATLTAMKDSAGKFTQIKKIASPILTTYDTGAENLHTVFLDEYGCVWTVGSNSKGQLAGGGSASTVGRISCSSRDKAATDVRVEVVFDITPPVISGIEDGSTYTEAKSFTVTDDYDVASVKINGVDATKDGESYKTNATGPQTIIATDTSGNTTTVSINKKPATIGFVKDGKISVTYDKEAVTAGTAITDDIQYTYTGDSNVPTITSTWYDSEDKKLTGAPKDVGSYKVVVSAATTDEYFAAKAEKAFEITRANATLEFTKVGDQSITYTGNKVKAGLASDDENTYDITYKYDGDGEVTATWYASNGNARGDALENNTPPTDVGTYYFVLTATKGKNYNAVTEVEKKVTITQAAAEITINEIADITYSGSAVTAALATAEGASTKNITYTYKGDSDNITVKWYKDNNGNKGDELEDSKVPTDAGTYWIGVSATKGTNYTAAAEVTKKFTIAKKDANLAFADSEEYTTTYNNSAVTVGKTGTEGAKITYTYDGDGSVAPVWYGSNENGNIDEDSRLTDAPTNAGTYYVVLTATEGDNYNKVTDGQSRKVTINKATAEITINEITGITYSGNAVTVGESSANINYSHTGDVTVNSDNIKWYNSSKQPMDSAPINAGTYYIGLTATEGNNYEAVTTEVQKQFTIAPYNISGANISKSVEIKASTDTFDDPTVAGVNSETVSGGTYAYEYTNDGNKVTDKNTIFNTLKAKPNGDYTVSVTFTAAADSNYKGTATGTINVTVNKTTPEIEITVGSNITYDGDKVEAGTTETDITYTYAGKNDNVTVTWYSSTDEVLEEAPTAAGNYKVGIKAAADSTYNEVTEEKANFTILKKTIGNTISGTATIEAATETFDDPTIGGAVRTETVPGDYTYKYGTKTGKSDVIDALKAEANGTYTVDVKFEPDTNSNYNGSATGTMTVTVQKETPTIKIAPKETITYDGSAVEVGTSGKDINYEYTGDSQNLTKKWYGSKKDGSIDTEKELATAPKNAGTYYIGISAPATSTYDKVAEVTKEFTIDKATISNKIENATATVNADTTDWTDPVINGVAIQTGNEKVTGTYQYSYDGKTDKTEVINALKAKKNGTYTVSVEFTPANDSNYTGSAKGEITVTVQKEAPTITFEGLNITYDGEAVTAGKSGTENVDITYSYAGEGKATVTWYNASGDALSNVPTAAGTYKIKVYVAPTSEYNEVTEIKEFKISPKEISSTITGATATVNANTADFDDPEIKGVKEEKVKGTYTYKYGTTTGKTDVINALKALPNGNYEVDVEFTPTDTNYTGKATGKMTVTVDKPKAKIEITVKENIVYNKQAVTAAKAKEEGESVDDITFTYDGNATPVVKWYANSNNQKGSEISAPSAAGTYWVGISAPATTSYDKVDEVTAKFEIKKADATITFEEPGTITYNNAVVEAGTKNTEDADITYTYNGDSKSFTTTWYASNEDQIGNALETAPKDAGTYYVKISASEGTNYNAVEKTQKFVISQADASITINTPGAITYDESPVVAAVDGTEGADITYKKVGDGQVKIEWYKDSKKLNDAPTDAGSYSVKIWAEAGKNYKAADVKEQSFTISRKDASITINEPGKITYSDKAVTAGTANADITYSYTGDGKVTTTWYASNGDNKGEALKSAPVNAGTYYIGVKADAGTNYSAVAEVFKKFTISKAAASITIAEIEEITYNGKAVTAGTAEANITYTNVGDGDVVIDWYKDDTKLNDAPKDAGTYSVKISANEGTNYEAAAQQTKAFTISPAAATIEIKEPGTITYDGDVVTIGKEAAAEGTETIKYDITYTYDGDDANPTIHWYSSDSKGDKGEALTEAPKSAGTYYVGISAAATNNYKVVTEVTQKFTIIQRRSSGGGAVTPNPDADSENVVNKAEDKENGTVASTTATIKDTATTSSTASDGSKISKTTATVDTATASKIVEKAVENKSKEVIIDVETGSTDTEAAAGTATEVEIPATTITQISEKTGANIIIKTDNASITFNKKAVAAAAKQAAAAGTLKLIVTTVEQSESDVKLEVKIETANGEIKNFKGGKVNVTVDLNKELASKKLVCVYINDKGLYSRISGQKNANGTYTFVTNHFSTYVIMAEEEADKIIAEQTAKAKELAGKIKLSAASKKTSKGNIKVTLKTSKGASSLKKLDDYGYTVKYKFYRGVKKSSGYKAKIEKDSKTYINTSGKKGTRYYYKARVMVYDDEGTLIASTPLKNCSYATRQWKKK